MQQALRQYEARSVIIGRKKRDPKNKAEGDLLRPCFISLFDVNDPHKSCEVPKKIIDFDKVHKVVIEGLDVNYLLPGNDLVINDLESISVREDGEHIYVNGKRLNKNL